MSSENINLIDRIYEAFETRDFLKFFKLFISYYSHHTMPGGSMGRRLPWT